MGFKFRRCFERAWHDSAFGFEDKLRLLVWVIERILSSWRSTLTNSVSLVFLSHCFKIQIISSWSSISQKFIFIWLFFLGDQVATSETQMLRMITTIDSTSFFPLQLSLDAFNCTSLHMFFWLFFFSGLFFAPFLFFRWNHLLDRRWVFVFKVDLAH